MKKKQRLIRRSALISPSPLTLLYIADEGDFFITQILPFFVSFRNFLCSQSKHLVKYTKRSIQDLQTKEEYPMAFADKLRALRHINNMTQDHLAQQMNLARTTIAGYESKNRQPSHENLFAFARFFHVSVDYLISDGEPVYITTEEARTMPEDALKLLIRYRRLPIRSKNDLLHHLRLLEIQEGIDDPDPEIIQPET